MTDINEVMEMYKEIQENYIKALERENEELRKQREKDSLKIEELEKQILIERGNRYIKNVPNPLDDKTVIGPGNGWGYPQNPIIWTSNGVNPTTIGGAIQSGSAANPTYSSGNSNDTVGMYRDAYNTIKYHLDIDLSREMDKIKEWQEMIKKSQKEFEDDN